MLDCLVRKGSRAGDGSPVLVLLHGRGSDMRDLQGLSQVVPEHGVLVTPQAPHPGAPWGYGPGWAWYRYLGQDRVEEESLFASLEALDGFLQSLDGTLGLRPGPLVIGGFSQGGSASLAHAVTRPGSVAGVVVLSGFLVNEEVLGTGPGLLGNTPVFWAHGTQDPAVPFQLALEGRSRLVGAGVRLTPRDYPMGHWVMPQEVSDLRSWLEDSVPGYSNPNCSGRV